MCLYIKQLIFDYNIAQMHLYIQYCFQISAPTLLLCYPYRQIIGGIPALCFTAAHPLSASSAQNKPTANPVCHFPPSPLTLLRVYISIVIHCFKPPPPHPTLANFRVQRVRWTVTSKRRQLPCESSVIVSLSWNSSTRWVIPRCRAALSEFPRVVLHGQCSHWDRWLFVAPRRAVDGMIQENRHVWLFSA